MKRYISPETSLVAELETAQGVMKMLTMSSKSADSTKNVLTKRQVWDDEEEWED